MTNVILISEDNHGTIGVATTTEAAKKWLIETGWVASYSELWMPHLDEAPALFDLYGEKWEEEYMKFDAEQMENLGFFFKKVELIE